MPTGWGRPAISLILGQLFSHTSSRPTAARNCVLLPQRQGGALYVQFFGGCQSPVKLRARAPEVSDNGTFCGPLSTSSYHRERVKRKEGEEGGRRPCVCTAGLRCIFSQARRGCSPAKMHQNTDTAGPKTMAPASSAHSRRTAEFSLADTGVDKRPRLLRGGRVLTSLIYRLSAEFFSTTTTTTREC